MLNISINLSPNGAVVGRLRSVPLDLLRGGWLEL
jgi:hypothetical protein